MLWHQHQAGALALSSGDTRKSIFLRLTRKGNKDNETQVSLLNEAKGKKEFNTERVTSIYILPVVRTHILIVYGKYT